MRRDVDALGNRVATVDALGNTACRSFDPFGNVTAEWGAATNEAWTAGGASAAFARTFDPQGRLASLSLPGRGYELAFDYDADGRLVSASNALAVVSHAYTPDGLDAGYSLTLVGGVTFTRTVARDPFRRDLATAVGSAVGGVPATSLAYAYDALSRPVSRNSDSFAYNARGEVTAATAMDGLSSPMAATYAYDLIGNATLAALASRTNRYAANCVNQYTSVLRVSEPPCETNPGYDADGNLVSFGPWTCAYDAASRLVSVSSNGVPLVASSYDWRGRRVRKATPDAETTFLYDGWNLVEERVARADGTASTIHYYWGKDISGSLQGAGGVGGLLYLTIDDASFVPCYDNNGNITCYLDANGNAVARYVYDAFGGTISASGLLADAFRFRFSTNYLDTEAGLYYYGYRFYSPALMRWLNRDPIEETGGENLYAFCENNALVSVDPHGQDRYMTAFSWNPQEDRWHVGVAVDTWKCASGRWLKTGVATFDFGVDGSSFMNRLGTYFVTVGAITEREGNVLEKPFTIMSTPEQDIEMLRRIREELSNPPLYSFFFNNCIHWSNRVINYGMGE